MRLSLLREWIELPRDIRLYQLLTDLTKKLGDIAKGKTPRKELARTLNNLSILANRIVADGNDRKHKDYLIQHIEIARDADDLIGSARDITSIILKLRRL